MGGQFTFKICVCVAQKMNSSVTHHDISNKSGNAHSQVCSTVVLVEIID